MNVRNLLFAQFGVVAIMAGLHLFGIANFLYWRLPWFDLAPHFLGGVWAALFAAWILALRSRTVDFFICFLAALFFAVIWEIFEVQALIIDLSADFLDSVGDVLMVLLGGTIGAYAAKFLS